MKKLIITLNLLLFVFITGCTSPSGNTSVQTLEIVKDLTIVDELDCFVGDSFDLNAKISDNKKEKY